MTQRPPYKPSRRHLQPTRSVGDPQPGYFWTKFCKQCPDCPVAIVRAPTPDPWFPENQMVERSHWWGVLISGRPYGQPALQPPDLCWRVWTGADFLDHAEYQLALAQVEWDRQFNPAAPWLRPFDPVDISQMELF